MCLTAKPTVEWTGSTVQVVPAGQRWWWRGRTCDSCGSLWTAVRLRAITVARNRTAVQIARIDRRADAAPRPRSRPPRARRRGGEPPPRPRRRLPAVRRATARRNVSMDAVAAAAGVGKGTLFRRFGDRAGLARAVLSEHEAALQDALIRGAPPVGPGAPARERLLAFGRAYLEFLEANSDTLLAAEYGATPVIRQASAPYAFYRTHVTLLLREAGCGERAEYLADVLLAPLSSGDVQVPARAARAVRRRARRRVRRPRRPPPRLSAMKVPASVEDVAGGLRGRRLPAGRVDRARLLPRRPAGQARAGRGPRGRRQDRAGQGAERLPRPHAGAPAVLRGPRRGQGAVRVELPQAAAAHPGRGRGHRLAGRAGRHLRRGVPAQPARCCRRSPPRSRSCC